MYNNNYFNLDGELDPILTAVSPVEPVDGPVYINTGVSPEEVVITVLTVPVYIKIGVSPIGVVELINT